MSINAKVDNQTYVGINTISVGGKTINLEEISSGGSGTVATGTFTPSENTGTYSINTGLSSVNNFIIQMKTEKLDSGVRAIGLLSILGDLYTFINTNASGSSFTSCNIFPSSSNSVVTLENGTINISSGDAVFVQTEYVWYAW